MSQSFSQEDVLYTWGISDKVAFGMEAQSQGVVIPHLKWISSSPMILYKICRRIKKCCKVNNWISESLIFNLLPITLLDDFQCKFRAIFGVGHKSPNSDFWKEINLGISTTLMISMMRGNQPNKIKPLSSQNLLKLLVTSNHLIRLYCLGKGGEVLWQFPEVVHSYADQWVRSSLLQILPSTQPWDLG